MLISKRKIEPLHYMLKIDSFSLLFEARNTIIESDVFEASGHKWRLDLYPNGNDEETEVNAHISLYLIICDTESLPKGWEVGVDANFFVYNHKHQNYAIFQDDDGYGTMFNEKNMKWGFDKLISLDSFKNCENGYLLNDSCVFGAEVFEFKQCYTKMDRCLSMIRPLAVMNTYTWKIHNFAGVTDEVLYSQMFKVGKVKWRLSIYPKGNDEGAGKYLSIYLEVCDAVSLPDGGRVYVKFKLRVKDQSGYNDIEEELDDWFDDVYDTWGVDSFVRLTKLSDMPKGFLLNGSLVVEAEILFVGLLKNSF